MADIETKILYEKDIKKLEPHLEHLFLLSRNLAETTQSIVMHKHWNIIELLSTNNFPNLYRQVIDKLVAQWFEVDSYFTDEKWFAEAMKWYGTKEKLQEWEQKEYSRRHYASWEDAIKLIKETFEEKDEYGEGELMEELLRLSYQAWASDVHFQSEEVWVVMRIRIDGLLQTMLVFPHKMFGKYLMKIKFQSWLKMNVAHHSQDWRFDFTALNNWDELKIDVRVSVMPGLRGESIVLRFLDVSKWIMSFENLWCEDFHIDMLNEEIKKNFWLILVTWPTGSWKTTTVYSILNAVNTTDKKIITLEDPVEYELPWIEQSQINESKWFTFEEGLKWVLRHDPDIIMVWEIRTLESAEMAVNAALTWHLVISTIHTNSAMEALTRLLNMWVKPFMLASSLNCIVGQRLLRKIAKPRTVEVTQAIEQAIRDSLVHIKTFYPKSAPEFNGTLTEPDKRVNRYNDWYEWRTAVYEILQINQTIKDAILNSMSMSEFEFIARKQWFIGIRDSATFKLLEGITSMEEVNRVL